MAYLSFRVVEKLVMVRRRKRSLVKSEEGWYFLFPLIFLLRAFIGKYVPFWFRVYSICLAAGAFGMRRPRRSAEHTGAGKSTYKPTRSSLTIRMTSDRLASPKMGVGRSLLHLAADHFYGQLPDQSCSGWKVLEVRWCYVVNYRSHMSSARNLKL